MSHVTNFALHTSSAVARLLSQRIGSIARWPRRYERTSYAINRGATTYILSSSQKLVALAVAVPFMLMMVLDLGLLKKVPPTHSPSPSGPPLAVNTSHEAVSPPVVPDTTSTPSSVNGPTPQSGATNQSVASPTNRSNPQPTVVTAAKTSTNVASAVNAPASTANPPANTSSNGNSDTPEVLGVVQAVVQTSSQTLAGTVKGLSSITTSLL